MTRTTALRRILSRRLATSTLVALWLLGTTAPVIAGDLTSVSTTTLNGTAVSLPADLPAPRTLVLLAFRHADQAQLAQWEAGMTLLPGQDDWLEIPVVGVSNPVIRSMILSGMKGRHHAMAERNHIAPLFGNSLGFARAFGVSGTQVAAIVIDHKGHTLAHVEGGFDETKARILRDAMTGR